MCRPVTARESENQVLVIGGRELKNSRMCSKKGGMSSFGCWCCRSMMFRPMTFSKVDNLCFVVQCQRAVE